MKSDDFNARLAAAANDDDAQASREQACETLTTAFRDAGQLLWVGGYLFGPDRAAGVSPFQYGSDATVALGTVCRIGSELMEGAATLLRADNLYAASALLRQMVEVEYLAWAFSEDEEEASAWIRSTHDERMRLWQPRHLRARSDGRFRGADYQQHCERGGHPTPNARALLRGSTGREWVPLWWFDLTLHGVSTWRYARDAFEKVQWGGEIPGKLDSIVGAAIERWEAVEGLREIINSL
ncbi:MAG TPA: hypothetical protein VH063_05440 [Gaiellaceae bacterium]|nr:hypothetical protein [Gaiellaceae bacterium]